MSELKWKTAIGSGHKVLMVRSHHIESWGGLGFCDCCNKKLKTGVLIPVLNRCYCNLCFLEWDNKAEFVKEDVEFENINIDYYNTILNISER